jgi:hypothetical protein
MIVRRSPFLPLATALAALAATLILGAFGPALGGLAGHLPWGLFGLALVGAAGTLAWHLARLTAMPVAHAGLAGAALPATLIPLAALPGIGVAALAVPAALAIRAVARDSAQRPAALLVLIGTIAGLGQMGVAAGAATLAAACLALRTGAFPAANDNPSMERASDFCWLPVRATYASKGTGDSSSGEFE